MIANSFIYSAENAKFFSSPNYAIGLVMTWQMRELNILEEVRKYV